MTKDSDRNKEVSLKKVTEERSDRLERRSDSLEEEVGSCQLYFMALVI